MLIAKIKHPHDRPTGSGRLSWPKPWHGRCPIAIADATALTEAGYVGEDVENILLKLLQAADFDIERAERALSMSMKLIRSLEK